jgi:hypothetical protein
VTQYAIVIEGDGSTTYCAYALVTVGGAEREANNTVIYTVR